MGKELQEIRFVYWQDGGRWLGYLEEFPDYLTQGESLEELRDNLVDLYGGPGAVSTPGRRSFDGRP